MDPVDQPDEEAMAGHAQRGDQAALLSLLDLYDGLVRLRVGQLLPAQVRRRVAVSDVMQETRIAAVGAVSRFEWRGEGSFRAWLMQIATNEARKVVRHHLSTAKRSRNQEISRAQRLDTAMHAVYGETPSQAAMAEEVKEQVKRALGMLPPDYREVLRLCREEDLTTREAALRMGRSREATKKLYGRALARLADTLDALRGGSDG